MKLEGLAVEHFNGEKGFRQAWHAGDLRRVGYVIQVIEATNPPTGTRTDSVLHNKPNKLHLLRCSPEKSVSVMGQAPGTE
ncbi:hypothetical protein GCM10010971_34740 [Silvimonas amylolytica]|uniref:Uncharacterized protein n=1 Tax=Silvimonas amylolytica TaxID=449663 RepID=A0ABQ2PQD6_9NEIS|nr:hypothetical protein GCM10010971_34740 [Silvimonas amylolytica]